MSTTPGPGSFVVEPVLGMPEIRAGDDLAALVAEYADTLADGDIVVVSSKIVSKAEGQLVPAGVVGSDAGGEPGTGESGTAESRTGGNPPGTVRTEVVRSEAVRVVAERGPTQIVQTRHGFVMAAAGIDASNVTAGHLLLLPEDPDASARALRAGLAERLGVRLGVIVTDTFGRPWRLGQTDLAIGAAGVRVLDDHRGRRDAHGNELAVTAPAHADELAGAAELVKGKVAQVPVAVVRGLAGLVTSEDGPGVRALVRPAEEDLFRLGAREAGREALRQTRSVPQLADVPVDLDVARRALSAVADDEPPGAHEGDPPWGLLVVEEAEVRKPLLDAVGLPSSVPFVVVLYVRTLDAARRTSALLALGGVRDRLALSCTVEGLASCWLSSDDLEPGQLEPLLPGAATEAVGLLAVGALPPRPRRPAPGHIAR